MVQAARDAVRRTLRRRALTAVVATLALIAGVVTVVGAATPNAGTIAPDNATTTWQGGPYTAAIVDPAACSTNDTTCDHYDLTVGVAPSYWDTRSGGAKVRIDWVGTENDYDLYIYDGSGTQVASSAQGGTEFEEAMITSASGTYEVRVVPFSVINTGYSGKASFVVAGTTTGGPSQPVVALTENFFHGEGDDEATGDAFFNTTPPDNLPPTGAEQIANFVPATDRDIPGNPDSAFWQGTFGPGGLDTVMEIETYWSSANVAAQAIGSTVEITVFADAMLDGSHQPSRIIGSREVSLDVGAPGDPVKNVNTVQVRGDVTSNLVVQFSPVFSDTGADNRTTYDTDDQPAAFRSGAGNFTPAPVEGLAAADAQGLAFSATVAADNQRDESEPLIEIDKDGNTYTCGPTGASQAAEYAQASTDGGDQFHLLGTPPRGQQGSGGGGDCSLALAPEINADGNYQYAYTGLGPLTNFTASTSADNGQSILTSPVNGATVPGVDRQWQVFLNDSDVLLSYNQQAPRQVVIQKSTDGGLTYGVRSVATPTNPSFPGPMRALPASLNFEDPANGRVPYFAWNDASEIYLSLSTDGGDSWLTCPVASSSGSPTLFVTTDHDSAGNVYVVFGEDSTFHTYITYITPEKLQDCDFPVTELSSARPPASSNPGWSTPVQVDRGDVRTSIFPWVTAGGAPGRVAVAFYGTGTDGNPNLGSFKASWDVYVAQSLNLLAADASFSQVKATTHPFHYDSICLEGLGCSVSGGDRSLADFFAIQLNPKNGELNIVYDQGSKAPDESAGQVATPATVRQIAGPSNGGGMIATPDRQPLRTGSADPTDDAQARYSQLGPRALPPVNEPGGDFTGVRVGAEVDPATGELVADGGFTVTMDVADLSQAALEQALLDSGGKSLLWVFRFVDGYRASAASARWNPVQGFAFGYDEYTTDNSECGGVGGGKCIQYPGDESIQGAVDEAAGTITLSVPRTKLSALSPEPPADRGYPSKERPDEVPATIGSRMYDATAFSLVNVMSPTQDTQGFLYPLDNTPAFDLVLSEDTQPRVSVGDASAAEGDGGTTPITFAVTLAQPSTATVTVDYATAADAGGTDPATEGTDYTAASSTVTFAPGDTSEQVTVAITGDVDVEPDETFLVELSNPTNATLGRTPGTGTITNDDATGSSGTRLSIGDASQGEGNSGANDMTFTVTRSGDTSGESSVEYTTAAPDSGGPAATAGEDYAITAGTLDFASGEASMQIRVPILGDTRDEPDEVFDVVLSAPAGATITDGRGRGTILDDDASPALSVTDVTAPEGDSGTTAFTFDATLSAASDQTVTVDVATADASATVADGDYDANSQTLTFPPGTTTQSFDVVVNGDTDVESDETFNVNLSNATNATLADGRGVGTITNDDEETEPQPSPSPTDTGSPSPSPTATETATPDADRTERLRGDDRFGTAVAVSKDAYADNAAEVVVLARGDDPDGYADALAGIPFANARNGPLLITLPDTLPGTIEAEIDRVLAPGATVFILGGNAAVSPDVEQQIRDDGFQTERIFGQTRIETAIAIARELGDPQTLLITTGFNFPDALAAGTAAAEADGAVLLTFSERRAPATDAYLASRSGEELFAVGGPAARPYPEATALVGRFREETAVEVAREFFTAPTAVGIARQDKFPDSLTGGVRMAALGGPILLTVPDQLTPVTGDHLCANADAISLAEIFGGTAAVSQQVEDTVFDRMRGRGC